MVGVAAALVEPSYVLLFEAAVTVMARWVMLKAPEVSPVRLLSLAVKIYPVPTLLIDRLLNVATPLLAAPVSVPFSVPLLGFVPIATVTLELSVVRRLPNVSSTFTVTAGIVLP